MYDNFPGDATMSDKPNDPRYGVLTAREPALKWGEPRTTAEWIAAGEFKAQCLRLIERISQHGGEYVVTRYGKPVAKLVPYDPSPPSLIGHIAGSVLQCGDLVSPIGDAWDADA